MTHGIPTRRRTGAVLAGTLAALLVLSACSGSGDEPDGEASSEAAADNGGAGGGLLPEAEGTTQYPLTIETWLGETVLEERPERIAVVGAGPASTNIDALEILGVTPVYVQKRPGTDYMWNEAAWLDDPEITDEDHDESAPVLERVAAAEPDLIIGVNQGFMYEDSYDELTQIAPVLEFGEQVPADQLDWRDIHLLIGETLDLGAAAQEDVDEADQAIDDAGAAHPEFEGRTITLAQDYGEEYGVEYYTAAGGVAEGIVTQLGFVPNPLAGAYTDDAVVSEENMADLDADVLVVFYPDNATRDAREENQLFQQIPAVAEGRYVAVSAEEDERAERGAIWALRRGMSPLSLPWTAELLAEWASEADLDQE
ncbi:MAG: ABC transporter substrate-binding protein [Actinomycetaceae bacterium]